METAITVIIVVLVVILRHTASERYRNLPKATHPRCAGIHPASLLPTGLPSLI